MGFAINNLLQGDGTKKIYTQTTMPSSTSGLWVKTDTKPASLRTINKDVLCPTMGSSWSLLNISNDYNLQEIIDDKMYLLGGTNNDILVIDLSASPVTYSSKTVSNNTTYITSASIGDTIYVVGQSGNLEVKALIPTASSPSYDSVFDTVASWGGCRLASENSLLYALQISYGSSAELKYIDTSCTITAWTSLPNLPDCTYMASFIIHNSSIYIVGAGADGSKCYSYSPDANSWGEIKGFIAYDLFQPCLFIYKGDVAFTLCGGAVNTNNTQRLRNGAWHNYETAGFPHTIEIYSSPSNTNMSSLGYHFYEFSSGTLFSIGFNNPLLNYTDNTILIMTEEGTTNSTLAEIGSLSADNRICGCYHYTNGSFGETLAPLECAVYDVESSSWNNITSTPPYLKWS